MKSIMTLRLTRINAVAQVLVLLLASLAPALLLQTSTSAATVENRFVDMSSVASSGGDSSSGSGRDGSDTWGQNVTYTVGFDMPSTGNVGAIVVEFCNDALGGPVVLETCTAPTGLDVNTGTAVANQNGISAFTKIGSPVAAANRFGVENGTPQSITSNTGDATPDVYFDITGITNPTVLGTFYARIIVYAANGNLPSTTWVSTSTDTTNGIGTRAHDGGVALATANHLTVTARVQEVLQFCIGTDDDSITAGLDGGPTARGSADDCTVVDGTDINLGVVESTQVQTSSDAEVGTSGNDGVAMIRTNAIDGATIYYKAEQDNAVAYANGGEGTLRIAGVDDCGTGTAVNNACFNSAGGGAANPSQTVGFPAGTELFGMTLTDLDTSAGGNTSALSCDAAYDGDGSCGSGAPTGYAWDPTGAFDTLASSSAPVDDEMVNIMFAATASPTTPTGLYTVTANFVATGQF